MEKEEGLELGEAGRWLMGVRGRKAQVAKGRKTIPGTILPCLPQA